MRKVPRYNMTPQGAICVCGWCFFFLLLLLQTTKRSQMCAYTIVHIPQSPLSNKDSECHVSPNTPLCMTAVFTPNNGGPVSVYKCVLPCALSHYDSLTPPQLLWWAHSTVPQWQGWIALRRLYYNLVKVLKLGQNRINTTQLRAFEIIFYINILLFPSHAQPPDLFPSREVGGFSVSRSGMGTRSTFSQAGMKPSGWTLCASPPRLTATWYSLAWPPWRHQSAAKQ